MFSLPTPPSLLYAKKKQAARQPHRRCRIIWNTHGMAPIPPPLHVAVLLGESLSFQPKKPWVTKTRSFSVAVPDY
jgi:hypothetical protein